MGAKRKGKQGQPRIRTHDNALERAERMGFEPVEYTNDYTVVEHKDTGDLVHIPATRNGTRPREQMSAAEWSRVMAWLVLGATRKKEKDE